MRSRYDTFELGIAALGFAAAAMLAAIPTPVYTLSTAELFRWFGVALLAQGFVRDVHILLTRRRADPGAEKRGLWICVESTLGLFLIGQGLLLDALGAGGSLRLPPAVWVAMAAAWWLFGYTTRELVLELRRDPDHLNLLVGFPSRAGR